MSEDFELPEKAESEKERVIGLIIAAIAVVLAVVSALAHETDSDKILAHVDAADQYALYQAKKERHVQLDLTSDNVRLQLDRLSAAGQSQAAAKLGEYAGTIQRLDKEAGEAKAKGDELTADSHRLEKKASILSLGEIALQISVVLCSITILTEQKLFVRMGVCVAVVGVLVALWGVLMMK